ncbi:hypothetical protein ANANG_G00171230 [Anguilla anguilla]|uniref:Uncharacterized protein n=1 Tax=Anguilla anguilla TaxID=7936 RepID=A0A9D3M504_ANGAN|nr:hypothetical protein ANANG_G00171230 [Anguilla anguilla]
MSHAQEPSDLSAATASVVHAVHRRSCGFAPSYGCCQAFSSGVAADWPAVPSEPDRAGTGDYGARDRLDDSSATEPVQKLYRQAGR